MKKDRKIFRIYATLGWLILGGWLFWLLFIRLNPPLPSEENPFQIFATENDDQLEHLFINGISSAKKSIYLTLYSLNDPKIIALLHKKRAENVAITILHDPSALKRCDRSFKKMIPCVEKKEKGLFHEKILIVDESRIWIGSANLTKESLLLDANFVIALYNRELAASMQRREKCSLTIGNRHLTYFPLPEANKEALDSLLLALQESRSSIDSALFTLTHPKIIAELIGARNRGVRVTLAIDHKMLRGASKSAGLELLKEKFPLFCMDERFSTFHHKMALIDESRVIMGSANWTKAAFEKNGESLLILDNLSNKETKKMKTIFRAISSCHEKITEEFFE